VHRSPGESCNTFSLCTVTVVGPYSSRRIANKKCAICRVKLSA